MLPFFFIHIRHIFVLGLNDSCRECGDQSLQYLKELKDKQSLKEAELGEVRRTLQNILGLGEVYIYLFFSFFFFSPSKMCYHLNFISLICKYPK